MIEPDNYDVGKLFIDETVGSGTAAQASGSASAIVPKPTAAVLLALGLLIAPILLGHRGI